MAKKQNSEHIFKSEFILLCDYAFTMQSQGLLMGDGGKLCIIGKFETIFIRDLPSNHPEMFIVAHFVGAPNSIHNVKLHITDPSGKEMIGEDAPTFKLQLSSNGTGNFMHRLFNFPINTTGEFVISFMENKNKLGSTKVSILQIKDQPKGQMN